jgi:hypothetical protein
MLEAVIHTAGASEGWLCFGAVAKAVLGSVTVKAVLG